MPDRPQIRVNIGEQRVWHDGRPVNVKSKVFALLALFLENPGRLLTKNAILRHVWPNTHVSDASVKDCVKNLRAVLHDDAASPAFIETVRGEGYRYLGGIEISHDVTEAGAVSSVPADGAPQATISPPGRLQSLASWKAAAALSISIALVVGLYFWNNWHAFDFQPATASDMAHVLPAEPSIAVMPFENISNDGRADIFARGLTDDLTTALGKLPQLFISARSASDKLSSNSASRGEVAQKLGVQYLLEGGVQRYGGQLRISVKLADALNGRYLWTEQYERPATELFSIQDEIVLNILSQLRVELDQGERIRAVSDTVNLDSWLASVAAYGEFLKFRQTANLRARQLWQEALDHDANRAIPYAGLAFTHYYDAYRGWSEDRDTSIRAGVEAANRAIELDPELPIGYQALGSLIILQGDFDKGLQLRRKAVELGPNDFSAIGGLASILSGTEQTGEAVKLFRRALRLNPSPPLWVPIWFGHALHMNGQAEEAAFWLESAIERDPRYAYVHARLAAVYADLGRMEEARSSVEKAIQLDPEFGIHSMRKIFMFRGSGTDYQFAKLLEKAGLPE